MALDKKLYDIKENGGHLVFLDECIFKQRDMKRKAWSNAYENLSVEDRTPNQPCQCICVAICACHGMLAYHQVDYAFDHESFMVMLDNIADAVKGNEKIYLFQDGASFHKNDKVKSRMKAHNMEPVHNVGYRFEYNPCERLWSELKMHYRNLLL